MTVTKGEATVTAKIAAGFVPRESTRQHILRVMREIDLKPHI